VSATLRSGSSASRACAKYATASPSARNTLPALGGSSPSSTRSSVDLPQPFGPSNASRVPGPTVRSTPAKIVRSP
jgi:hypothetical protein